MIRLGTRGSQLARTQSGTVADAITALSGQAVKLVTIRAEGDDQSLPLDAGPRPGLFVSALRDALLAERVDVLVHSFKDLPSAALEGITVVAVPGRATALDVVYSTHGGLDALPENATVGTSSPRRAAGLKRLRPDLRVVAIRGNVDTRLQKVRDGEVDAVMLAAAGLERLGLLDDNVHPVDPAVLLPAPAQGALAVECRTNDRLITVVGQLDDTATRIAVSAERAVLQGINASCTTAIGAHADWVDHRVLLLSAELSAHAGVAYARVSRSATVDDVAGAERLGLAVAESLLEP